MPQSTIRRTHGADRLAHSFGIAALVVAVGCGSSAQTSAPSLTSRVVELGASKCKATGGVTYAFEKPLLGSCASSPQRPADVPQDDSVAYCATTQFTDMRTPTVVSCPRAAPYSCKVAAPNTIASGLGRNECVSDPSSLVGCEFLGGCVLCGAREKPQDISVAWATCTARMTINGTTADLQVFATLEGATRAVEFGVKNVRVGSSGTSGDYTYRTGEQGFELDGSRAGSSSASGWQARSSVRLAVTAGDPSSSAASDPCPRSVEPLSGWSSSGWSGGGAAGSSSSGSASSSGSSPCPSGSTGAVCADSGKSCADDALVNRYKVQCGGGATDVPAQRACHCQAWATARCFIQKSCYAEAGANTTTSQADLAKIEQDSNANASQLGATCNEQGT